MIRYQVFHPDHMMRGQNILSYQQAIENEHVRPFFERHGLVDIDPETWYPEQRWLDVLSDIANSRGAMFDLVSIGLKIAENAVMPPELAGLPLIEVMKMMNEAYKLNNRGTDTGDIKSEVINHQHVKLTLRLPSSDDLWYGVTYGYMRRFAHPGMHYEVYYDKDVPRREQGGEVTIIHVEWEE